SINEFNAASCTHVRRFLVVAAATVVVLIGCFGCGILFRDSLHAFYIQWFGESVAEVLMGLTPAPALLVLFGGIWLVERRARRDRRLFCMHCGKNLFGLRHLVIATRN